MNFVRNLTVGKVLIATVILGFSVLLFGGCHMFANRAPVPGVTVAADGGVALHGGTDPRRPGGLPEVRV